MRSERDKMRAAGLYAGAAPELHAEQEEKPGDAP